MSPEDTLGRYRSGTVGHGAVQYAPICAVRYGTRGRYGTVGYGVVRNVRQVFTIILGALGATARDLP